MAIPLSRREVLAALLAGPLVWPRVQSGVSARDLTSLTASEAARRIARGEFTPSELTEAYLARIAAVDPAVHAFVTVTADRARADARRMSRGMLRGIPIAHKDLFETAGILTTAGSRLYRTYRPSRDAALVASCARAGTVLLGKTNTHELGGGVTTINPFYGTTHNPADPTRIAGGSSGGSAAAVAARLTSAATGSDTGGSVRIPAAFCGCVGFKPSFGRISTAGLLGACPTFDHAGLLTRTAEDATLFFRAVAGLRDPPSPLGRLRVGVPRAFFFDRLHPDVDQAMTRAMARFRSLGALVRDLDLPVGDETMARVFDPIVASEIWSRYRTDWRQRPGDFSPDFGSFFAHPAPAAAEVTAARRARVAFQNAMTQALVEVDVLMTPTVPVTAPPIAGPIDGGLILRNTWPFNAARMPAISIPCVLDSIGLPVGLQIAARPGADEIVLDAARRFLGEA